MFESILKQNTLPRPKYAVGLGIALSVHAAALLGALWLSTQPPSSTNQEPEVILYQSLPPTMPSLAAVLPPPPPPPPPEKSAFQLQELKKNKIIKPVAIPAEKPPEKEPEAMLEESSAPAHPLSAKYGAEGGDPDTHFHPALHGKPGPIGGPVAHALGVIPFGEGMAPPKLMKDPLPIRFTREALEARVEGRAVVRCTITVEGNVENCRFLQSLPYMDEAILSALSMRTYSPATYQGKKISVDYNIPIRLKLP